MSEKIHIYHKKSGKTYTYYIDIRIQKVDKATKDHLSIICAKLGVSYQVFIKSQLPYIIEKFYQDFPESRPIKKDPE